MKWYDRVKNERKSTKRNCPTSIVVNVLCDVDDDDNVNKKRERKKQKLKKKNI